MPAEAGRIRDWREAAGRAPRLAARALVFAYRMTLSAVLGRHCRHLPSCSVYADEALDRHGLWPGGWMTLARLCRCRPGGTHGIDWVPERLPASGRWYRPWRYGRWRTTHSPVCEAVSPSGAAAPPPR